MDIWLNPETGDYEYSEGTPTRDPGEGLANAIYIRLMTPLGTYWQEPLLGSRLHELAREKDKARVGVLAKQYCENALQPIIDDGRATRIDVDVEQPHDGRLYLLIEAYDAAGRKLTYKHPVKVF